MLEAWLLFDEQALRAAAGNPRGHNPLPLPRMSDVESIPDPKVLLFDCIRTATELPSRRLRTDRIRQYAYRLAEYIDDYAPLRQLSAFVALEQDVQTLVVQQGWNARGLQES